MKHFWLPDANKHIQAKQFFCFFLPRGFLHFLKFLSERGEQESVGSPHNVHSRRLSNDIQNFSLFSTSGSTYQDNLPDQMGGALGAMAQTRSQPAAATVSGPGQVVTLPISRNSTDNVLSSSSSWHGTFQLLPNSS